VQEDEAVAAALHPVHRPDRAQRGAARPQRDAHPVLVGVQVRPVRGAPQPHVRTVGEQLHRRRWSPGAAAAAGAEADGGEGVGSVARREAVDRGESRAEGVRCEAVSFGRRGGGGGISSKEGDGLGWNRKSRSVTERATCPPAGSQRSSLCHVGPALRGPGAGTPASVPENGQRSGARRTSSGRALIPHPRPRRRECLWHGSRPSGRRAFHRAGSAHAN
jgi:hypothetical protein